MCGNHLPFLKTDRKGAQSSDDSIACDFNSLFETLFFFLIHSRDISIPRKLCYKPFSPEFIFDDLKNLPFSIQKS